MFFEKRLFVYICKLKDIFNMNKLKIKISNLDINKMGAS